MQIIKSCEGGLIDQGYKGWVLPKSKAVDIDDEEDGKTTEVFSCLVIIVRRIFNIVKNHKL